MLFAKPSGEGTIVHGATKRQTPRLDDRALRLFRAQTFETFIGQNHPVATIARIFSFAESTVNADLAFLRAERARVAEDGDVGDPWD